MFISSDSYEGGKQAGKAVVELWRSNSLKQRLIILSKSNKRYLRRDSVQSNCPKKEIMGRNSGEKIADFLDHKTVIAIEGIGMYEINQINYTIFTLRIENSSCFPSLCIVEMYDKQNPIHVF